jgi:hyperosmotically inducible protein
MDEVRHIRDYATAFTEADDNKDGKLDKDEFIKAEFIHSRIIAGKYISDSVLTAKVKAALLKEPELKSLDVSVETLRGEVLLSGFVTDEGQRQKAMRTAVAVDGVTSVKDLMLVR